MVLLLNLLQTLSLCTLPGFLVLVNHSAWPVTVGTQMVYLWCRRGEGWKAEYRQLHPVVLPMLLKLFWRHLYVSVCACASCDCVGFWFYDFAWTLYIFICICMCVCVRSCMCVLFVAGSKSVCTIMGKNVIIVLQCKQCMYEINRFARLSCHHDVLGVDNVSDISVCWNFGFVCSSGNKFAQGRMPLLSVCLPAKTSVVANCVCTAVAVKFQRDQEDTPCGCTDSGTVSQNRFELNHTWPVSWDLVTVVNHSLNGEKAAHVMLSPFPSSVCRLLLCCSVHGRLIRLATITHSQMCDGDSNGGYQLMCNRYVNLCQNVPCSCCKRSDTFDCWRLLSTRLFRLALCGPQVCMTGTIYKSIPAFGAFSTITK